ncbi:MAG: hypothetical protein NC933_01625, partial [Candidatus Omnitrophica bacterium]|nr:hypothetical protein [Candidatus Omnitrophota bacterium]
LIGIVMSVMSDSTVKNSYAVGTVTGEGQYDAGGLIGFSGFSTIQNCYANVAVDGDEYVGGLIGNEGMGRVTNCYATGSVTGNAASTGGLVGYYSEGSIYSNNWWYNNASRGVGIGSPGNVTKDPIGKESFYSSAHQVYKYGQAGGWDIESHNGHTWIMAGYPHLQMERTDTITNIVELQMMALDLDADYTLANDIDASETASWNGGAGFEPVGTESSHFSGSLAGNSKTISGLYINRSDTDYVGLFGYANLGANAISNLNLNVAKVKGGGILGMTGGLIGYLGSGTVSNCSVTINSGGEVSGTYYVGGLVGENSGTIDSASVDIYGTVS